MCLTVIPQLYVMVMFEVTPLSIQLEKTNLLATGSKHSAEITSIIHWPVCDILVGLLT